MGQKRNSIATKKFAFAASDVSEDNQIRTHEPYKRVDAVLRSHYTTTPHNDCDLPPLSLAIRAKQFMTRIEI